VAVLTAASFSALSLATLAPRIRVTFDLSTVEVGLIGSAVYVGAATSAVLFGRLTDRVGPGRVITATLGAMATGLIVAAVAGTAVVFFLGVAVAGLGYGGVNPPTNLLADTRRNRRRGTAMGVKQTGIPLGGVLAGALLPVVAASLGWRLTLLLPIGLCLLLALGSWSLRGPRDPSPGAVDDRPRVRMRGNRGFLFGSVMGGVQVTVFTYLVVYLVDARGFTAPAAGVAFSLALAGGVLGRVAWGAVSDRYHDDRLRVLQANAGLSIVSLAAVGLGPAWLQPVALFLLGASCVGWNGVFIASVAESVERSAVGAASGRSMVYVNVGAVAMPPGFGAVVAAAHSWSVGWAAMMVMAALAGLVLQVSRREPRLREDPALGRAA
jgi:MFS family permease